MTKKEAMDRYSIPIPVDFNNYNKEEYIEFDKMFLESFYTTFYDYDNANLEGNNITKDNKIAIVLGGQAGAGKSSLVADANRKFKDEGRRIVVIDDDAYRKFYPYSQDIIKNCPEYYTDITATATNIITPKILKFASENGYNFIFDGTMKNTRIVNTMKTWKDYDIYVHIMAACGERSLISTAMRNALLRKNGNEGRLVEQKNHWDMYNGVPETLEYIKESEPNLVKGIKIFTRGTNPLCPIVKYSSLRIDENSRKILEELRLKDRNQFFESAAKDDIECLKGLITNLSEKEKREAESIIAFIEVQMNKVNAAKNDDEQNR